MPRQNGTKCCQKGLNVEKMKCQKVKRKATSLWITLSPNHQLLEIPNLHALRHDSTVQAQVQQRLK